MSSQAQKPSKKQRKRTRSRKKGTNGRNDETASLEHSSRQDKDLLTSACGERDLQSGLPSLHSRSAGKARPAENIRTTHHHPTERNGSIPSEAKCVQKKPDGHRVLLPLDMQQEQGQRGFPNLGNTCYMNASIQSLFSIPTFTDDLLNQGIPWEKFPLDALLLCLNQLLTLRDLCDVQTKQVLLENVKISVSSVAEMFSGNLQNDAHEFLSQCLIQMKEDMEKLHILCQTQRDAGDKLQGSERPPANTATTPLTCPVVGNFELELESSILCEGCGQVIHKTQLSHDISISLSEDGHSHPLSIQRALALYFEPVELEYRCGRCKSHRATSVHKFSRLPRVLIVHLQRHAFNARGQIVKDTRSVSIPKYLSLSPYCDEHTKPPLPLDGGVHPGDCHVLPVAGDSISVTNSSWGPPTTASSDSEKGSFTHNRSDQGTERHERPRKRLGPEQRPRARGGAQARSGTESPVVSRREEVASEGQLPAANSALCQGDVSPPVPSKQGVKPVRGLHRGLEEALSPDKKGHSERPPPRKERDRQAKGKRVPGASQGVVGKAPSGGPCHSYRVLSIVSHMGDSCTAGHYISDAYDFQKQAWFHYDDNRVRQIQEEEILKARSHSGYLFFYMHDDIFKTMSRKAELLGH